MIKNSLKNFYKNLIYLFVPMGIVYLFFLITVCLLFTTFFSSLSSTLVQLTDLIKTSVDESSTSVSEFIAYALEQIDWNQGFGNTLQQIFDTDWIQNTIKGFFEAINASTVGFEEQFTNIVSNFVSSMAFAIISAIIICFLGIVLANYATKYVIRRKVAKRNIKKFIIARTIVPLVQSIIIGLFFVLVFYLQYYSILVAILFLILLSGISILSSWMIHKNESLKLKDVLNMKNIAKHLAVIAIIMGLNIVIAILLFLFNKIFAVLLMIPLVIYSLNIIDVNTDSYVCSLIQTE